MTETRWWRYVNRLLGDDSYSAAADRAKFDKSAFTRWKKGAAADPAFVVKLARAYNANVLEALVEAEFLTEEEAGLDKKGTSLGTIDLRGIQKVAKQIDDQQKALQRAVQQAFPPKLMERLAEMQKMIDSLSEEELEAVKRDELDLDTPGDLEKWRGEHSTDKKAGNVVDLHPNTPVETAADLPDHDETTPSVRGDEQDLDEALRDANNMLGAAQHRTPRLEEPENP